MKGDRMTEGWCLNELVVETFVPWWLLIKKFSFFLTLTTQGTILNVQKASSNGVQHHHYGHHDQVWCVHYLPSPDKTSTCYASPNHPFDFPGREQWTPTSMRDWRIFRYQIVLRWGAGKVHTDDHPYIPMAGIWAGQHYSSRAGIWPDQLHSSISWDPPTLFIILIGNMGPLRQLFIMSWCFLLPKIKTCLFIPQCILPSYSHFVSRITWWNNYLQLWDKMHQITKDYLLPANLIWIPCSFMWII